MQLLCLEMPRTGTDFELFFSTNDLSKLTGLNSSQKALEGLGYTKVYHGFNALFEKPESCRLWLQGNAQSKVIKMKHLGGQSLMPF
jgi:hypothetical protein